MSQNDQLNFNSAFKKDDAYRILQMINTWISNIDTKVSFSLSLVGVLIGTIFSKGLPSALKKVGMVSKLSQLDGGEFISVILVCSLYIVSFITILCFMLAIVARIKNHNSGQSILFFGSIAKINVEDYKIKASQMTEQDLIEDLEEQIHINSMICNKKARCYNRGIKFLLATIILWFICMTFRLI